MRLVTIAAALVFSLPLVACGSEEARAPLTLEQRVVGAAEAPGSEPDPDETQVTATGLEELETELDGPPVYDEDIRAFGEAGFVSLVIDTRFFPSEPGGEHIPRTSPHVFTVVYEFESEEGANAAVNVAHRIGLRPCPETCAYEITDFQPAGVPNAKGVQAIATQESIDRIGDDIEPDARYSVYFADGPFAYEVTTFGPPDEVSRQQVEDIAAKLYARVKGAPLPEPS
jgi:hypothetical protein